MKINFFYLILFIFILLNGCTDKKDKEIEMPVEKESPLDFEVDFPSTVYTHKKYKGKITFYNSIFDTIVAPRRDTVNFRAIIYKPFKPYLFGDDFSLKYKDSILLENNTVDVEFEFDKAGTYNIGGLVRDGMMIGYYTDGIRDSVRIIEHEIVVFYKVIAKDSI